MSIETEPLLANERKKASNNHAVNAIINSFGLESIGNGSFSAASPKHRLVMLNQIGPHLILGESFQVALQLVDSEGKLVKIDCELSLSLRWVLDESAYVEIERDTQMKQGILSMSVQCPDELENAPELLYFRAQCTAGCQRFLRTTVQHVDSNHFRLWPHRLEILSATCVLTESYLKVQARCIIRSDQPAAKLNSKDLMCDLIVIDPAVSQGRDTPKASFEVGKTAHENSLTVTLSFNASPVLAMEYALVVTTSHKDCAPVSIPLLTADQFVKLPSHALRTVQTQPKAAGDSNDKHSSLNNVSGNSNDNGNSARHKEMKEGLQTEKPARNQLLQGLHDGNRSGMQDQLKCNDSKLRQRKGGLVESTH